MFPLLILSKRLHSIFMLRCFNDCFAVLGLFSAIYAYQNESWHLGTFFYTTGLNVKMSLLLPLPAMGIMMLQALGSGEAITQALIVVQVSVRPHRRWKLVCHSSLTGYSVYTGIPSVKERPTISPGLSNSPANFSTSGLSTGDSFQKASLSPDPLPSVCYPSISASCTGSPRRAG